MAISPLVVAHMPNIGVIWASLAAIRKPASPPMAEASTKASVSVRVTGTPTSAAARLWSMTLRTPRPKRVWCSAQ